MLKKDRKGEKPWIHDNKPYIYKGVRVKPVITFMIEDPIGDSKHCSYACPYFDSPEDAYKYIAEVMINNQIAWTGNPTSEEEQSYRSKRHMRLARWLKWLDSKRDNGYLLPIKP